MLSYDEILNNMKNAYFEQTGENPDMQGDLGFRFKAVASQIFDMAVNADFVLKQSSWKTATGESLDNIGLACGVVRKQPTKAQGTLTFSVAEPKEKDLIIPAGTICSKKDEKFIQYVTLADCLISAGGRGSTVEAEACGYGEEYNCDFDQITVMVNPPTGVDRVCNTRFSGGWSCEEDEAFRIRIGTALCYPHNGLNKEYLCNRICQIDEVLSCKISYSENTIFVWCKTRNSLLNDGARNEILSILDFCSLINLNVLVLIATGSEFDTKILCSGNATNLEVQSSVQKYFSNLGVGDTPSKTKLESYLRKNLDIDFVDAKLVGGNVAVNQYPVLNNVEVVAYDN